MEHEQIQELVTMTANTMHRLTEKDISNQLKVILGGTDTDAKKIKNIKILQTDLELGV